MILDHIWSLNAHLSKTVFERWEGRKARVFGEGGLLCKSFNLFKILQERSRKKARASSAKRFKVEPNPRISLMMFGLEKP